MGSHPRGKEDHGSRMKPTAETARNSEGLWIDVIAEPDGDVSAFLNRNLNAMQTEAKQRGRVVDTVPVRHLDGQGREIWSFALKAAA